MRPVDFNAFDVALLKHDIITWFEDAKCQAA
jgi:hypothetical protein